MELIEEEKQLARTLGFDEDVLRIVKQEVEKPLEPYERYAATADHPEYVFTSAEVLRVDNKGFAVRLGEQYGKVWERDYLPVVYRMRSSLIARGYMAFLCEDWNYRPCLAILKTLYQYEIMRVERTCGMTLDRSDLSCDELIAELENWRHICEFDVIGAGYNHITLSFKTLPDDLRAFAERVVDLAWDSLEQQYGFGCYGIPEETQAVLGNLTRLLYDTQSLYLWWD